MESETKNREEFRRYLLGELSDEDCAEIESSLLEDGPYEQLLATEQDMIDRYVRGEMDLREAAAFEFHYVDSSPERLQRVAVASAVVNVLPKLVPPPLVETKKPAYGRSLVNLIREFFRRHKQHSVYAGITMTLLASTIFLAYKAGVKRGDVGELEKTVQQLRERVDDAELQSRRREEEVNKLRQALESQEAGLKSQILELQQERAASQKRERELLAELEDRDKGGTAVPQDIPLSPHEGTAAPENDTSSTFHIRSRQVRLILRLLKPGQARRLPPRYDVSLNGQLVNEGVRVSRTRRGSVVVLNISAAQLVEGLNRVQLDAGEEFAAVGYVLSVRK